MAEQAHSKGFETACLIQENVPTALRGDPGRLRQILLNLLGNAVKFTDQGEVVVQLSVAAETHDTVLVHCAVRDTGIGIAPEGQERLFNPFRRPTLPPRGNTVALALVWPRFQLTNMMGGTIGVQSVQVRGVHSGSPHAWASSHPGRQPPNGHTPICMVGACLLSTTMPPTVPSCIINSGAGACTAPVRNWSTGPGAAPRRGPGRDTL